MMVDERRVGEDRRAVPREDGPGRRAADAYYLTPSDVCERFRVDIRTLDKFDLPWVWFSARVRRIHVDDLERWVKAKGRI